MEESKMARTELNEERLDEVVGGAFHYYTNSAGKFRCKVDNVGTYYAKSNAFGAIAAHASDVTLTAQQVVDWALAEGYLSTKPLD